MSPLASRCYAVRSWTLCAAILSMCCAAVADPPETAQRIEKPAAAEPAPASTSTAAALNAFAFDLLRRQSANGNLVTSPASVEAALGMLALGAEGRTAEQIAAALHVDPVAFPHAELGRMLDFVDRPAEAAPEAAAEFEWQSADALWAAPTFPFRRVFIEANAAHYGATLRPINFLQPSAAADAINAWVAEQTRGNITQFVKAEQLQPRTKLVLTDAAYFRGRWSSGFDTDETASAPFHTTADRTVDVALMHQAGRFAYAESPEGQIVELPYAGDAATLVVVLPAAATPLAEFESRLTIEQWQAWTAALAPQTVDLYLPRCRLQSAMPLRSALEQLGVTDVFGSNADLSGITSVEGLQLTDILQQATLELDEAGTVGTAAAAAMIGAKSMAARPEPRLVRADRPFLFFLRQKTSGLILFAGRVTDPTPAAETPAKVEKAEEAEKADEDGS